MTYPASFHSSFSETIHGKSIDDPFRWLESLESQETMDWVSQQREYSETYLNQLPGRNHLINRLRELWDFEKFDIPIQKGNRIFFARNNGLQNQPVYFWQEGLDGDPHVLIDPNLLSEDGTVALVGFVPSPNGKYFAYGLSSAGSDWMTWMIREVDTGLDLPDLLEWVKFSGVSWTSDSVGFFYSRYDAPESGLHDIKNTNYFQKLYFHNIRTFQSKDVLIHQDLEHKEWGFGGEVTDDGLFLVISVWQGTHRENGILIARLDQREIVVKPLITGFEASYQFLGNLGDVLYFETDLGAPNGRIIAIDLEQPDKQSWQEIVPETESAILFSTWVGSHLFVNRLHDVISQISCYDLNGQFENFVELPDRGTVSVFGGVSGNEAKHAFFLFTNFFTPLSVYRYDLISRKSYVFRQPKLKFEPTNFTMRQVFYSSKDGTQIPMFICHRKDLEITGTAAAYLYAYGGFNAPSLPAFSVSVLLWMEIGGVFAMANIRGGGEYGKKWHEAGMKSKKQNVFDDFIAAGEWLIQNGITNSNKLAIGGRSNGGLLIGACLTQRPDLFGAALPIVGVMDMLRFHKFTIGWAWVSDYGSPDNAEDFEYLKAYSPYHNIKDGVSYPPTLVCTGDHDDRVFPAHSYKFAARLQSAQEGSNPILIRIDTNAGHGLGKPTMKLMDEIVDQWAFLAYSLKLNID